jgi:single-strand DNA-binding protein
MNDTPITIAGNVCDDPTMRFTKSGHPVTNLRVASTSRRYDQRTGQWVDNPTLFLSVTCWRSLAENVSESVHKGDPVVVTGRLTSQRYEVGEQLRYVEVLEATSLGHDLARGKTVFTKAYRGAGATNFLPADENGVPADDAARWVESAHGDGTQRQQESGTEPNGRELAAVG